MCRCNTSPQAALVTANAPEFGAVCAVTSISATASTAACLPSKPRPGTATRSPATMDICTAAGESQEAYSPFIMSGRCSSWRPNARMLIAPSGRLTVSNCVRIRSHAHRLRLRSRLRLIPRDIDHDSGTVVFCNVLGKGQVEKAIICG